MKRTIIVDGYNVIHACDRYKQLRKHGAKATEKLVLDLINLAGGLGAFITVVFDGRGSGSEDQIGGVKVIYSGDGVSADSLIEALVFGLSGEEDVAVCTADLEQQRVVGRHGIRRITPRELEQMMAEERREWQDALDRKTYFRLEDRLPAPVRTRLSRLRKA